MIPGKIHNLKRANQHKDFSGFAYGKCTPTDIDGILIQTELPGFLEIQNRVFIFLEFKLAGKRLDVGQRIALERLADGVNMPTLVVIAEHYTTEDEEIDCASCVVRQYRSGGRWYPGNGFTVKSLLDRFLIKNGLSDWITKNRRACGG